MSITTGPFKIIDHKKDCFRIKIDGNLTGVEAASLREEVTKCINSDYDLIYIDTKDVNETDLSGINEVIHSHYTLEKESKKLILVYKKNSAVEKWVETTGLDKFVETAILPATL
jgi:anti-anti-sigma factor